MSTLNLIDGWTFEDLYRPERLADLTAEFDGWLQERWPHDHALWRRYRDANGQLPATDVSHTVVRVAPAVSEFVARLFRIEADRSELLARADDERRLFDFKRDVVKKRILKRAVDDTPAQARWESCADRLRALGVDTGSGSASQVTGHGWEVSVTSEQRVVDAVAPLFGLLDRCARAQLQGGVPLSSEERMKVEQWASLADVRIDLETVSPEAACEAALSAIVAPVEDFLAAWYRDFEAIHGYGGHLHPWVTLRHPRRLDATRLVQLRRPDPALPELADGPEAFRRPRDGFALTDRRFDSVEVASEVDYCLLCQDRQKDSCSKGFPDKSGGYKPNAQGVPLAGCPLEEKIGEAHALRATGDSLAALVAITIDNPMCPGTGHRICNDCMKACVFQKQDPVNIPQTETGALTDVLGLTWGFELYGLLTRWNPLHPTRPHPRPYIGRNVLVVGTGPAGYTLSHHLLREGFGVVAVDGLKIEPLASNLTGPGFEAIERWSEQTQTLDSRITLGFGGVSEYGITHRWDKNFLTLIAATLQRWSTFDLQGGIRFGGTISLDDAWDLGFDHVALCAGAGRPTLVDMPNGMIRGIRQASDFLMSLQLSGAHRADSLAALQVRLPAVVIGGGLTAIDTATELQAYYVVQCEKLAQRFDRLAAASGEASLWAHFDAEEQEVLREQLAHGRAIVAEREQARREHRPPDFIPLVRSWGGVTLVYRRRLEDSPAYRLNHEEIAKSLEEGIFYAECLSPTAAVPDSAGAVAAIRFERMRPEGTKLIPTGETVELPARTVCVAAGTQPNTTYGRENQGALSIDPRTRAFVPHRIEADAEGRLHPVPHPDGFFTSYARGGLFVSFFGDNLPKYAGSVVRAMASAKDGHPAIVELFPSADQASSEPAAPLTKWTAVRDAVREGVTAVVRTVRRLAPQIVEVVVHAPLAARKFEPGQFYRLQNFESSAPVVDGLRLATEGLALTGASADPTTGLLSMIVLEMGVSSRLVSLLRPGERVVVMGPTGTPTEIPRDEKVVLVGGGLGNAVLFSIGRALRASGCRVVYFAGYRQGVDVVRRDDIEAAADQVVWAVDRGTLPTPRRDGDRSFQGNIVDAMVAYATGNLGASAFPLTEADRILAIGSDRMMNAVRQARHGVLASYLRPDHVALGSINSPMQCMMKEICAQCLQRHVDPVTGEEKGYVFSCFNQDQPLDSVDFAHLSGRLRQTSVGEKVSDLLLQAVLPAAGNAPCHPPLGGAA